MVIYYIIRYVKYQLVIYKIYKYLLLLLYFFVILLCIDGELYGMNNFDEDYVLKIINDDRILENYLNNASIKELNLIYGALYCKDRLNDIIYKYPDIFNRFLNALDDNDLFLLFENIEYDCDNNYFGEYLFNNLINRNRGYLIVNYFIKLIGLDNDIDIYDFVGLMNDVRFYDEGIIEYISNIDLDKYPVLVDYINRIIESDDLIDLSKKIISNDKLIKYVTTSNILDSYAWPWSCFDAIDNNKDVKKVCGYKSIDDMYDNFKTANYDELRELFLDEDDTFVFKNLIDKLNCKDIIRIIKLNFFVGINNNMSKILEEFFIKYVSFEKAIFLVDVLSLSDSDKVNLINSVYNKDIVDFNSIKEEIIKRNLNKILDFSDVDLEFRILLPDLINISYDEEFFEAATDICLNIYNIEYMQVFLSQLIKYVCAKRGLEVKDIEMNKCRSIYCGVWWESDKKIQVYYNFLGNNIRFDTVQFFVDSCFHELRHVYQDQKIQDSVSIVSLMCILEKIMCGLDKDGYYMDNYSDVFIEVDARNYGVYDTFYFLKSIDCRFDEGDYSESENYLEELDKTKEFIKDRNKSRDIEYFCNILNNFFELVDKKTIIVLRSYFKSLELITNKVGRPYSYVEIEEIMNAIDNYGTNDLEFNKYDRDTWLFYKRYLHILKEGLDKNFINIDFNHFNAKKIVKKILKK